jgi:hypothetical protein
LVRRGPAWRSGLANTLHFLRRFSRTSRWKLTSSSLFAKRGCRLACFGTQHCALLIVPPIVSSATPTLEAPVFWRTSVSHAAWDVPTVHGAHAVYRVSKLGTARGNRLEGCVKRRLLHERAGAQPIRQGTPAIPRRETCAQSAAGSHFCRLTTRNGADGRDLHSLQWIFGGAGRTRSP